MAPERELDFDVAIIGAGPAGLAAATELRRLGVARVAIIEREAQAGGIPRHCGHYPFGMREFHRLLTGPDYAARLVSGAKSVGVAILTGTTVIALAPGPRLSLSGPGGLSELSAARVLVATGVREASRAARLIGGTKPGGVMSTGALQGLVYLNHQRPFQRPVVLGSELVSFSALFTCRHAGIKPVAMVEPNARITAFSASAVLPRLLGVPLLLGTEITRIVGDHWVEAVELNDGAGRTRTIEADGVIVSGNFLPEASLLQASHLACCPATGGPAIDQFGRCGDPDFFAAGNLLRAVETAGWSWEEGCRAARAIVLSLDGTLIAAEATMSVAVAGDALKYAVPQRIVLSSIEADDATGGSHHIQLRVTQPVHGRLSASLQGREVWSRQIRGLPERRILVPVSALPREPDATLIFSIREARS